MFKRFDIDKVGTITHKTILITVPRKFFLYKGTVSKL
jgi:hypothetical protein